MLLERRCPGCGAASRSICRRCLLAVETSRPPDHQLHEAVLSLGLDGLHSVGTYDAILKRVVLQAKNGQRRDLYRALASLMVAELDDGPLVVTWVPPSRSRRRQRGFDHGRVLAAPVARLLGVRCDRLLIRADRDRSTTRSRMQRLEGPKLVARRASPASVLLVDDVLTTGGSLAAATRALREVGARRVIGAVLAMVDDACQGPRSQATR